MTVIVSLKKEAFSLGSLLIFLIIVNYRVLGTWFVIDDTACIFCSSFDTIKLLFDRGTYLFFNQLFFTPLLPISFKLDWFFFKMNPLGYHIHNLLIAYLCCVVFYQLQRMYLSPFFSWLGAVFLSLSLPVSFNIAWITRKHYLWGFLLSLIALSLFKRWEGEKKSLLFFLSLLSALAAFLFKEAYTFLPAILFLISNGSLKERAKKSLPYLFVLAVYLFWRIYMLGSIGGYPGSTGKSFLFFLNKLFHMPMDLSGNLFGFSLFPVIVLVITAFLSIRMFLLVFVLLVIVVSPFVFFPEGGFLLANKALSFVAVISFALSFIAHRLFSKHMRLAILFFITLIPVLFGSLSRTVAGQNVIIQLSSNYQTATQAIIDSREEKILAVGNYAYYFSNLEDIYRKMLGEDFPFIRTISDIVVLPYLDVSDFDKIILAKNFDLNPDVVSGSTVEVKTGSEGKEFLAQNLAITSSLKAPEVNFVPEPGRLKIVITDSREGMYLRCLHMGTYVGCYPIPKNYAIKYNGIKNIDRIDILYLSEKGERSEPATFR